MKKTKNRIPAFAIMVLSALLTMPRAAHGQYGYAQPVAAQPAAAANQLTPKDSWIKIQLKLNFLPENQVADLIKDVTNALHLQNGQITSFHNLLLIYAAPDEIDQIKGLVARLDVVPKHIIFEATLINVDTTKVRELGIQQAKKLNSSQGADGQKTHLLDSNMDYGLVNPSFQGTVAWTMKQGANTFNMTVGYLLENEAAEVVSKPVVRVRDGGSGSFENLINVPQQTTSANNGTNVVYKPTGISIAISEAHIIPNPTPDADRNSDDYISNLIWAKLEVTDGSLGAQLNGNYSTNDTAVKNEGYYESGHTYIIASLVKDNDTTSEYKVPGLSKLPFFGKAFRSKASGISHKETIILMRPTIEEKKTHEFLASHYPDSQDFMSITLGGRNRDSINLHPFSDAMWKGVPAIYDTSAKNEYSYWALAKKYKPEEIETMSVLFRKVRNRVGLILGQKPEQIEYQIMSDNGIAETVKAIQWEFQTKYGKDAPSEKEFLTAAAHYGVLNQWAFDVYKNKLQEKR